MRSSKNLIQYFISALLAIPLLTQIQALPVEMEYMNQDHNELEARGLLSGILLGGAFTHIHHEHKEKKEKEEAEAKEAKEQKEAKEEKKDKK
ncbi:hypothetical protein GcM1_136013 [Golovinomyces cichoracearum]|uniref:Uncharacterized protein n=1 Tax=Golovinomyces cichoracearum TaxID=62708 RepID=A0A420JBN8_9PEZI|nr:hypothetical protein GcM1_136013 [Golovinomyces cichoracearum]